MGGSDQFDRFLVLAAASALGGLLVVAVTPAAAWVRRLRAGLVASPRTPLVGWGLFAVGGAVFAAGPLGGFGQAEPARPVRGQPHQPTRACAVTDRGTPIVLGEPETWRSREALTALEEQTLRNFELAGQVIRRGGPTDRSNCHGWVFTGGKFLLSPDDVELILRDNGYAETHEPQPGDAAIYRPGGGAVTHSAVVRYVAEGQPVMVEGKWGRMGVFLHPADRSLYGPECAFYRSGRAGHLLVGVGGASPDPSVTAPLPAE